MNDISDNVFAIRQQINILYRLIGKANLYVSRIDGDRIDKHRLSDEMHTIHKLLKLIEDDLNCFL